MTADDAFLDQTEATFDIPQSDEILNYDFGAEFFLDLSKLRSVMPTFLRLTCALDNSTPSITASDDSQSPMSLVWFITKPYRKHADGSRTGTWSL